MLGRGRVQLPQDGSFLAPYFQSSLTATHPIAAIRTWLILEDHRLAAILGFGPPKTYP